MRLCCYISSVENIGLLTRFQSDLSYFFLSEKLSPIWRLQFLKPLVIYQQAGTGPSRRHIQGSKIAKRLPSVKYSFTVVETRKFFEIFFLKKLHTKKMDRVARRGSLPRAPGALTSHNAEKLKRGTL